MGGSHDSVNAIIAGDGAHIEGFLPVFWSVINAREDMRVEVNHKNNRVKEKG